MKYSIRHMQARDVPQLVQIVQDAMPHPWTKAVFDDCFNENAGYFPFVLTSMQQLGTIESEILGFIVVLLQMDEGQILNICIKPAYQHLGLGKLLLEHVMKFLAAKNMRRVTLEVRRSNLNAIHFYRRLDFIEIGMRKNYYPIDKVDQSDKGFEDALIFERFLA